MATSLFLWEDATTRESAGRARHMLEGWGGVRLHRLHSGDASLPGAVGPAGGRGSPSDMPAIFDAFVGVDEAVKAWGSPMMEALLCHVYVHGIEKGPRKVRYLMTSSPSDKSPWVELDAEAEPPVRYLQAQEVGVRTVYRYDWDRFRSRDLDKSLAAFAPERSPEFRRIRRAWLESLRSEFALWLVARCGLGEARREA